MWNSIIQRAAPYVAELARGSKRFAPLVAKLPNFPQPDDMLSSGSPSARPRAPENGDLMPGMVPAIMKRMGIDTFDQRFNGDGSKPGASFDERFGPNWGFMPSPVPPAQPDAMSAAARAFPAPIGSAPQGNPFPQPIGIAGMNENVGNMADPSMLSGNLKARQVIDPASGQMMNDFYSKSLAPSFFRPFG